MFWLRNKQNSFQLRILILGLASDPFTCGIVLYTSIFCNFMIAELKSMWITFTRNSYNCHFWKIIGHMKKKFLSETGATYQGHSYVESYNYIGLYTSILGNFMIPTFNSTRSSFIQNSTQLSFLGKSLVI